MKRRDFFKTSLMSLATFVTAREAFAAACKVGAAPAGKKVAKNKSRLDYVLNAADAKGHKKFKAGSNCLNCKWYKKKKEVGGYAPCPMMANKYVSACGWCKSWKKI
jgi:hypothetical protein